MNRRIRTKQNRDFLEIIIKNHILELQNIELQINLQIQQKIIGNLSGIALQQKSLIEAHNLNLNLDEQQDNDDNIELEIDEEDDPEIPEENEDEPEPEEPVSQKRIRRNASSNRILKNNFDEDEGRKGNKELL